MIDIQFFKLSEDAIEPRNAYGDDAGWDLFTLVDTRVIWSPSKPVTDVRTGIAIAIPEGYYGRIVQRSSSPRKKGIQVLEGIIDSGFRGELFAAVIGLVEEPPIIRKGESVAQLIIQQVEPVRFRETAQLPESLRGEKGFGSSGH